MKSALEIKYEIEQRKQLVSSRRDIYYFFSKAPIMTRNKLDEKSRLTKRFRKKSD